MNRRKSQWSCSRRTTELKASYKEMVAAHVSGNCGVYFDTTNKVIRITKPTTVRKLYSLTMDTFDNLEYMMYAIPMFAITEHLIELVNGWSIENASKDMVREGSWEELGNIYISAIPMGSI